MTEPDHDQQSRLPLWAVAVLQLGGVFLASFAAYLLYGETASTIVIVVGVALAIWSAVKISG